MALAIDGHKYCPKCKETKPVVTFSLDKRRGDGLKCWCKDCNSAASHQRWANDPCLRARQTEQHRIWAAANPDLMRGYVRAHQKRNPEKTKANTNRWNAANKPRIAERNHGYYATDPEKFLTRCKAWNAKNPEWLRAYSVDYRAANPLVIQAAHQRRKAKLRGASGSHTAEDILAIAKSQKYRCAYCRIKITSADWHVDHIIPVSRGGSDDPKNLQLTCASCNLRKKDKDPLVFARKLGRLL